MRKPRPRRAKSYSQGEAKKGLNTWRKDSGVSSILARCSKESVKCSVERILPASGVFQSHPHPALAEGEREGGTVQMALLKFKWLLETQC